MYDGRLMYEGCLRIHTFTSIAEKNIIVPDIHAYHSQESQQPGKRNTTRNTIDPIRFIALPWWNWPNLSSLIKNSLSPSYLSRSQKSVTVAFYKSTKGRKQHSWLKHPKRYQPRVAQLKVIKKSSLILSADPFYNINFPQRFPEKAYGLNCSSCVPLNQPLFKRLPLFKQARLNLLILYLGSDLSAKNKQSCSEHKKRIFTFPGDMLLARFAN